MAIDQRDSLSKFKVSPEVVRPLLSSLRLSTMPATKEVPITARNMLMPSDLLEEKMRSPSARRRSRPLVAV